MDHFYGLLGGWVATAILACIAFFRRFNKDYVRSYEQVDKDHQRVISGKDELIKLQETQIETFKTQYERENEKLEKYRQYCHDELGKANEKVTVAAAEVADLRARTDLTPLHKHIEQQTTFNQQMIQNLADISETLKVLVQRITGEK